MNLLIRKRTCFKFVYTSWIYVHVSWLIDVFHSLSHVFALLVPPNPTMHYSWKATPYLSARGNNLDFFFSSGLIPNKRSKVRTQQVYHRQDERQSQFFMWSTAGLNLEFFLSPRQLRISCLWYRHFYLRSERF